MKIAKSYDRIIIRHAAQYEVDLARSPGLSDNGNLWLPLSRGYSVRLYPYEDFWVKLDDEFFHVDSKDKFNILVNKIMTQISIEQL